MKLTTLLLFGSLLFAGCRILNYAPLRGEQPDRPVTPGNYAQNFGGTLVYHGYPEKPYIVLGQTIDDDILPHTLARVAREHGADAVLIISIVTSNGDTIFKPGMTLSGGGVTVTTPSTKTQETHTSTTALFIKFQ